MNLNGYELNKELWEAFWYRFGSVTHDYESCEPFYEPRGGENSYSLQSVSGKEVEDLMRESMLQDKDLLLPRVKDYIMKNTSYCL